MAEDRVQHYRLIHRLGAGGMGEVYLAHDPRLGRQLALKLLPAEFAQDAGRRARFLTEARAAAALNHPNICTVYDAAETAEGLLFIALELLEGETLDVRLKGGPLEAGEVVRIGVQLTGALEAAHIKGILHRDLKPSNLHLDARGHLKVLDFGLAKRLLPEPGEAEASTQWRTQTGRILGTPHYMSPEQALGKALDARSDLFSAGAVLYELLTGRSPFSGQSFGELVEQIVHGTPEAMARFNYAVPAELERAILKCLQKDPDLRYQSAQELAVDLRSVQEQRRGEAAGEPSGLVPVLTRVLLGTNAEELERTVGMQETARLIKEYQKLMGERLRKFSQARQEESFGSTVLLSFARPSNAVQWALEMVAGATAPLQCRAGLHLGEVASVTSEDGGRVRGSLTVCEQLLQLAQPGQVLLGRAVFDSARAVLSTAAVEGAGGLSWLSHGPYLFEGIEGPLEVCEVGAIGRSPLSAPKTSEKAHRQARPDEEPVLGWRPAVGQAVPNTPWVLEEKLGEGGFGEVWVAKHPKLKERRVFKFCFRADRVRALKREMTLFRLLKESVGDHPNIVRLYEVYLEEPPFYLEEEFVEGKDLRTWCEAHGGMEKLPLATRLEIVAQAADALQAAHDAGIIHRDVKPGNILVSGQKSEGRAQKSEGGGRGAGDSGGTKDDGPQLPAPSLMVKLADFGIGQVISADYLKGVTQAGFTQTMVGNTSSGTGTTMYLAPELIAGSPATIRSDIYSLGVVLYQLLIGDVRRPLTADWSAAVSDPLLREDLHQCLKWDPNQRFNAAASLAERLRHHPQRKEQLRREELAERSAARRRRVYAAAAVAMVALGFIAATAYFGMRQARRERDAAQAIAYASDMQLASQHLLNMGVIQARKLLDANPRTDSGAEQPDWEWRFLWSRLQPQELYTIGEPGQDVYGIALTADGRVLAGVPGGGIRSYDLGTGRLLDQRKLEYGGNDTAPLELSQDGGLLVAASQNKGIAFLDLASLEPRASLSFDRHFSRFDLSPDGRWLGLDGHTALILVDVTKSREVARTARSHERISDVTFSPDSQLVASGAAGGRVGLWRVPDLAFVGYLGPPRGAGTVARLAFSPDGQLLAVNRRNGQLECFDVQTGKSTGWVDTKTETFDLSFSPDGVTLACTTIGGIILVCDASPLQVRGTLQGHQKIPRWVRFTANGDRLVTAGWDGIKVWDPRTVRGPCPSEVNHHGSISTTFKSGPMAPNGRYVAVLPSGSEFGELIEVGAGETQDRVRFPFRSGAKPRSVSADGRWVLGHDMIGNMLVADTQSQRLESRPLGATQDFNLDWTFGPRGERFVTQTCTPDKAVGIMTLWEARPLRSIASTEVPLDSIRENYSLVLSPDGAWVAAALGGDFGGQGGGGNFLIWNPAAGRMQVIPTGHTYALYACTFLPDGKSLVVADREGNIDFFSLQEWPPRRVRSMRVDLADFWGIACSADGKRLFGHSSAGLYVLSTYSGRLLGTFNGIPSSLRGYGFAVHPDGNRVVQLARGNLQIWHAPSWAEIEVAENARLSGPIASDQRDRVR